MGASILVLCTNRHLTGVTVTFYRRFGRFTGFRDGQGDQGLSEPEFYGDLVYKLKKIKGMTDFSV